MCQPRSQSAPSARLPAPCAPPSPPRPSLLSVQDVDRARGCRFDQVSGNMGGSEQGSLQSSPRVKVKPLLRLRGSWSGSRKDSQLVTLGDFPGSWGDGRKWESREARSLLPWRPPRCRLPGEPEHLGVRSPRPRSQRPPAASEPGRSCGWAAPRWREWESASSLRPCALCS